MSGRTNQQWARAFRDCGVLRIKFDDPIIIAAIENGVLEATPVDENEDWLDCRPSARTLAKWRAKGHIPAKNLSAKSTPTPQSFKSCRGCVARNVCPWPDECPRGAEMAA